jgi:hypothetical protein
MLKNFTVSFQSAVYSCRCFSYIDLSRRLSLFNAEVRRKRSTQRRPYTLNISIFYFREVCASGFVSSDGFSPVEAVKLIRKVISKEEACAGRAWDGGHAWSVRWEVSRNNSRCDGNGLHSVQ